MTNSNEIRAEVERRYPYDYAVNWLILRKAFIAGAEWQASHKVEAAPSDTDREEAIKAVSEQLGIHRWKNMGVSSVSCECGEDIEGVNDWTGLPADVAFRYHLACAILEAARLTPDQLVQVEVTDEMVERAAIAAWEAIPDEYGAEPWDETDEADREASRAQLRAALTAALGGGDHAE